MYVEKTLNLNTEGTAVIALGAALSGEIDVRGFSDIFLRMPAAWTAANIAFHTCEDSGGTFTLLRDEFGNARTVAVVVDDCFTGIGMLAGIRYLKLASVDQADPTTGVNQAAARTIEFALES